MDEWNPQVGNLEYAGHTVVHPVGLALVLLCGLAMLRVPRRYAIWPMIVMACFVAQSQRIVLFGLNFDFLRVMVLFAWLRIVSRGEQLGFNWKPIDYLMLAWSAFSVLDRGLNTGQFSPVVTELGAAFDAIGMYFAFRCLVRDWSDVDALSTGFVLFAVPVALAFLVEKATGRNPFAFFGGVPEITVIRGDRLRCQGAFSHPILAGCFWAAVIPLCAARFWSTARAKQRGILGVAACLFIIFACGSSTPVLAVMLSAVGGLAFLIRRQMRLVRWGILFTLIGLHLVMKAPVWHLVSRFDMVGGSDGWHRYHIIDQTIRHFSDWWLIGTASIASWEIWASDITNQFVLEAIAGGLPRLILFVAIIASAFAGVGRLWRQVEHQPYRLALAWGLGVALFVHIINFIGVSYFGQIIFIWYLLLALIGSLAPASAPVRTMRRATPSRPESALLPGLPSRGTP